jgi:hypothetical protein
MSIQKNGAAPHFVAGEGQDCCRYAALDNLFQRLAFHGMKYLAISRRFNVATR